MNDLSLVDLLQRARQEPRELERLFSECRNYLNVLARAQVEKRLQSKVDASDLVQQTLLEAYRDFRNFRGGTEAEWLAWLRRILSHNAANFIRHWQMTGKRQARKEVPLGPGDSNGAPRFDPPAHGESPSQELLRKERELLVADAVAQLPPDYQEVINLRNLQQLPFQDVADRMGRSRPAVQMLWLRALNQLQQILAGVAAARDSNA